MTRTTNPVSTPNDTSDLNLHVAVKIKRDLSANQMRETAEERIATGPHTQNPKLVETLPNNRNSLRRKTRKGTMEAPTILESTENSESKTFHGAIRLENKTTTAGTRTSNIAGESSKSSPTKKSEPKNFHGAVRLKPKSGKVTNEAPKKLRSTLPHFRGKKETKLTSLPTKKSKSKNFHGAIRLKPKPGTKSPKKVRSTLPYTRRKKATKLISLPTKRSKSKNFHGAVRLKPKPGTESPKKDGSTLPYTGRNNATILISLPTKRSKSGNFHGAIRLKPKPGTESPKKVGSTLPYTGRNNATILISLPTKRSKSKNFHGVVRLKPKSGTKTPKKVGSTVVPYSSREKAATTVQENPSTMVYCLRRRVVHGTDRFRIDSKKLKWMDSGHFFRVYRLKPSLFTGSPFRFRYCPDSSNSTTTLSS